MREGGEYVLSARRAVTTYWEGLIQYIERIYGL